MILRSPNVSNALLTARQNVATSIPYNWDQVLFILRIPARIESICVYTSTQKSIPKCEEAPYEDRASQGREPSHGPNC